MPQSSSRSRRRARDLQADRALLNIYLTQGQDAALEHGAQSFGPRDAARWNDPRHVELRRILREQGEEAAKARRLQLFGPHPRAARRMGVGGWQRLMDFRWGLLEESVNRREAEQGNGRFGQGECRGSNRGSRR